MQMWLYRRRLLKHGIEEDKLSKLADELGGDDRLHNLGFKLGFKRTQIMQYLKTNRRDGVVGSEGTRNMLFAWKEKTSKKKQVPDLRKALVESEFVQTAEEYFPLEDTIIN